MCSTLLILGGSIRFVKPLFLHVGPVQEEADPLDLPLCLVTLVPTDPEVGPLGEEVVYSSPCPSSSSSKDTRRQRAPVSLG